MKAIKRQFLPLLLMLAGTAAFSGCSTEEPHGTEPTDGNATFIVSVNDGGYASPDTGANTRANENSNRTTFTAGDKIGVFAVKNNGIVNEVNNLCLTAKTDAGKLLWTDASGKTPLYFPDATYYAYYPYQSGLTGNLDPGATDAESFFAQVISSWTPATDQSTYANYTAQDLMVAKGTVTDKSLSFSMTHRMALVVIELPKTKYKLSTDVNYTWTIEASNAKFTNYSPCHMDNGTYRYLVHPTTSKGSLSGSYTNANGHTAVWNIASESVSPISAGNYKVFKVDGGIKEVTHTLQVGDFYMNDGSLVEKDAPTLSDAQKAACIGVVFWRGNATEKDQTLKADHAGCTHGLVVALKDAIDGTTPWQKPYSLVQDWLNSNQSGQFLPVASGIQSGDPLNNIQGYNNTKAIEAFNTANSDKIVQSVQKTVEYRTTVSAPANSSNWYLPSAKEWTLLCGQETKNDIWNNNRGGIKLCDTLNGDNGPFKKLGNSYAAKILLAGYWSSTEADRYDETFRVLINENGYVGATSKDDGLRVRCILAF